MPVARVGRLRLHYERAGRGEPLLLVTGFAISAAVFEPVLEHYTPHLDCISYDNRGAGRSSAPLRPTTMAELASDAVRLLDVLGVDSAHVYGLSMGGMIAQEVALRFPDRVRGLVLGGTTAGGPGAQVPDLAGVAGFGSDRSVAGLRARYVGGALFSPAFRREHPDQVTMVLAHLARHRARPQGLASHWWAVAAHDTASRLARIAAPTLVLHGELDALTPLSNARYLARRIPDAELAVVPGTGHAYLAEQPELSARLLLDWLDRRRPQAGPSRSALAVRAEPLSRALAVPLSGARAWRAAAGVSQGQLRRLGRATRTGRQG